MPASTAGSWLAFRLSLIVVKGAGETRRIPGQASAPMVKFPGGFSQTFFNACILQ